MNVSSPTEPTFTRGLRAPLLWLLGPLVLGYSWAEHASLPFPWLWWTLGLLLLGGAVWQRRSPRALLPLGLALVILSALHYRLEVPAYPSAWQNLPPREAELVVEVEQWFNRSEGSPNQSGLARVVGIGGASWERELLDRRLYVSVQLGEKPTPLEWARSARLQVRGLLVASPKGAGFAGYLQRRGAHWTLSRGRVLALDTPPAALWRWAEETRQELRQLLMPAGAPPEAAGLAAMMTGETALLADEDREAYTRSGTLHLFAVSGMHIVVITVTLHGLLGVLRLGQGPRMLLSLTVVLLYVLVVGAPPSAVRAWLMVAIYAAAHVWRRQASGFGAWTLAAVLVLLLAPRQLWDPGFQLSYAVVGAIFLVALPVAERLQGHWALYRDLPEMSWRWHHRLRDLLWRFGIDTASVSLAASLACAPLVLEFFHLVSPGGVLVNILLGLAGTGALIAGTLATLVGAVGATALSVFLQGAGWLCIEFMDLVIAGALHVPGAVWDRSWLWPQLGGLLCLALLGSWLAAHALPLLRQHLLWSLSLGPLAYIIATVLLTQPTP